MFVGELSSVPSCQAVSSHMSANCGCRIGKNMTLASSLLYMYGGFPDQCLLGCYFNFTRLTFLIYKMEIMTRPIPEMAVSDRTHAGPWPISRHCSKPSHLPCIIVISEASGGFMEGYCALVSGDENPSRTHRKSSAVLSAFCL